MAVKVDLIEGQFTREEYLKAIEKINAGLTQLEPDGRTCAICGDGGHQAWECHHNPLVLMKRGGEREGSFRCFHCGDVFTDDASAREHFGIHPWEDPACLEVANKDPKMRAWLKKMESARSKKIAPPPMEPPDDPYFPERGGE